MPYDELASRLSDGGRVSVAALPDGSRDRRYAVHGSDERIDSRERFGRAIAAGAAESFELADERVTPGGQAVNAARQAHALGDDVTLVGLLDDPLFHDLPFRTASTGEPSRITVFEFDDGDVLFADPSPDAADWSLDVVADALGESFPDALRADAVFCGNWVTFDGMTGALCDLADAVDDGNLFVFDPGDVTGAGDDALADLIDALRAVDRAYDVVVSVDGSELAALADAAGADVSASDATESAVAAVRERVGASGVVRHETDVAIGATDETTAAVPNLSVDDPVTDTGAGDRFGAGLAHGLARGWDLELALALGNCCATQFVETGETGTRGDLRERARSADR